MAYLKKIGFAAVLGFFVQMAIGQTIQPVQQLKDYVNSSTPAGYSPRLGKLTLTPKGNLHYLFPLYHALKDSAKFIKIYSEKGYYDELSQYYAFAGDYQTALQCLEKSYDSIDDTGRRKIYKMAEGNRDLQHVDARRYISFAAKTNRVVMINEHWSKPLHRAFTISLLSDLYRQGYHYLALEMLNNFSNGNLTGVNLHTGYYTAEPVAGEMVRTALAIGYKLVAYEDTAAAAHTVDERDSIQALNLYKVIQADTGAKILVHAAFAHISKKKGPDGYTPMGLYFKRMSGIDPLTIDQTDMTEESNFGFGRVWYQAYQQRYPVKTPSIALLNNEAVNVTNNDLFDLIVIHPPTLYQYGRPAWLSLGGMRKPFYIKPPMSNTFLVQAYYQDEYSHNSDKPWQLVPADQTYVPGGKNNYMLYLKPGKYEILFRDIDYHILRNLNIEVN